MPTRMVIRKFLFLMDLHATTNYSYISKIFHIIMFFLN
jgi:hypothetical protein